MSDIFNPPPAPDFASVECPECGVLRGVPCSDSSPIACNGRQYIWHGIMRIKSLQTEWIPDRPLSMYYTQGWNDAIDAICERLRGRETP